jgi:hypothetical protein
VSQASLSISNQSGAGFRADVNTNLQALGTLQSGATAPATTYAYMLWADTTAGQLKQRNAANNAWVVIGTLGSTNLGLATLASPTFTGTVTIPAGASISGYLTTSSASSTYAPLASPTFTGTVTIPAGASISGYATTSSLSSYAALSGSTFTGNVTVQTGSQPQFILNSTASGSWKSNIRFQNSGTAKYEIGVDTNAAGANNFYFYDSVAAVNRAAITSTGVFQFDSGYGSSAAAYGCRAWVNFNGTGTVAIRASGNVSSITDNGVGDYTVNFTTALVDADYAVGSMAASAADPYRQASFRGNVSPTTTQLRVATYNSSSVGFEDASVVTLCIFR